jgi:hypothetical protein
MEGQLELYRSHHQLQEKYVFYIVALCVSAIGFSIYCTMGKPLQYSQILLLIAVLCWAGSIFCGLNYIKNLLYSSLENSQRLDLQGRNLNQADFQKLKAILDIKAKGININLTRYYAWQEYLFYAGVVFFIGWHILQMYYLR